VKLRRPRDATHPRHTAIRHAEELLIGHISEAVFGWVADVRSPPVTFGKLASSKKFVARLHWGSLMPTIWAGVWGMGPPFITAQTDAIRQAGNASAERVVGENSALIYRRLGRPKWQERAVLFRGHGARARPPHSLGLL
jgi:hypothetical protein